jgi:hypothetical protein
LIYESWLDPARAQVEVLVSVLKLPAIVSAVLYASRSRLVAYAGVSRELPSTLNGIAMHPKARNDIPPRIEVPGRILHPHRMVSELQAAARSAVEDKGVLRLNFERVLRVRTSSKQLNRALLIMDTLIKELERRGHVVRIGDKYTETELVLREGAVSFRLDERTTRIEPPPRSNKSRGADPYESRYPRYIMAGTGEFTLEFGKYRLEGSRRVWRDKVGSPLEAQLNEVFEAVPSWEGILRERRLESERSEARAKEAEARRLSIARDREALRLQRTRLVGNLEAWERAQRLRAFILAVEASMPRARVRSWLDWADKQVRLLDPIVSDPASVTSLDVTVDPHFRAPNPWDEVPEDWWNGPQKH